MVSRPLGTLLSTVVDIAANLNERECRAVSVVDNTSSYTQRNANRLMRMLRLLVFASACARTVSTERSLDLAGDLAVIVKTLEVVTECLGKHNIGRTGGARL